MLAYRLFGSRLVALFAMLLFLLHPRLYAHSFFNTKDLPFLSMFAIALYLIHRGVSAGYGLGVRALRRRRGILANIRIMGAFLIPAALGMLALNGFYAMKRAGGGG